MHCIVGANKYTAKRAPFGEAGHFCVRENLLCDIHQTFIGSLLIPVQLADCEGQEELKYHRLQHDWSLVKRPQFSDEEACAPENKRIYQSV